MNEQARILMVTAGILRFCAYIFAVFGLIMFAYIYMSVYRDNPVRALTDPMFAVCILVSFMPAAVLSFACAKKEKQALALMAAAKGQKNASEESKAA